MIIVLSDSKKSAADALCHFGIDQRDHRIAICTRADQLMALEAEVYIVGLPSWELQQVAATRTGRRPGHKKGFLTGPEFMERLGIQSFE